MEVTDGIVLLTDLSYTMADDHITIGLWGGTNSEGSYKEFNHYISLKAGGWHLALWDTYNFSPGATYNNKQYWNYSTHTTDGSLMRPWAIISTIIQYHCR